MLNWHVNPTSPKNQPVDRLDALQLFTRIVELGSISRAAAALEIPRATASHAIQELETRLGTRLLDRTTRHVRPTSDGQAFYERCVYVLSELDDAESSLRHLAVMPQVVCAGPAYLASYGTPRHPDELSTHQTVKFFSVNGDVDYPLQLRVEGQIHAFALDGWMSVNDAENYVICALSGCGSIQLPRFHVEDELREGRLVEILSDWPGPDLPLSALYPYHRQLAPRVRVLIDWLRTLYEEKFGANLASPA